MGCYADQQAADKMPIGYGGRVERVHIDENEDSSKGVDGEMHELDFAPDGDFVFLSGLIGHIYKIIG